jgi:hypothetical protein
MGEEPASPAPQDANLSQYNEAALAGLIWHVSTYLGEGDAQAGFPRLLRALHDFHYKGYGPADARQLRDAIVTGGLEKDSADIHTEFDNIFTAQNIGWGFEINVSIEDARPPGGGNTSQKIHLKLTGPYGTCQVTGNDENVPMQNLPGDPFPVFGWVVKGGLPYDYLSDCITEGGDTTPRQGDSWPESFVDLDFPYLADEKHLDGRFRLYATYVCANAYKPKGKEDYCTGSRDVSVHVTNLLQAVNVRDINLVRNSATQLLWFDATGKCQFTTRDIDCGY